MTVVVLILWLAVVTAAGLGNIFEHNPALTILVPLVPTIILLSCYRLSSGLQKQLARLADSTLILFQSARVVGAVFILYAVMGLLPKWWGFLVGPWDLLIGLSAAVVAGRVREGLPGARTAAKVFNILGLADFGLAILLAFVALPGHFRMIAAEPSTMALGQFPLILITAFGVPLAIGAHLESLRRLQDQRR